MAYNDFSTIGKVKKAFDLTTVENVRFLPVIEPIAPSSTLVEFLQESLPLANATGSEKARSELIISPVLLEVRKIMERQIAIFSGESFDVDESVGLNGRCDFLISRSPELMEIEALFCCACRSKKS